MSTTLIGVLIGALSGLAGGAMQLWFSARQRERDRYMQLRRDIYLEVAQGLASSLEFLQQSARTDVPPGKAETALVRQGWLFKAHLVAGTATLIAMNEANASVAAAALELLPRRLAVADAEGEITIVNASIESLNQFQNGLRSEAKSIDLTKPSEPSLKRFESLKYQLDESWRYRNEELSRLEQLTTQHALRARDLIQKSVELAGPVQRAIRDALLAARAELEVDIEKDAFDAATANLDASMRANISRLIDLIQIAPDPSHSTPAEPPASTANPKV